MSFGTRAGTDLDYRPIFFEFWQEWNFSWKKSVKIAKTRSTCKQNERWSVSSKHVQGQTLITRPLKKSVKTEFIGIEKRDEITSDEHLNRIDWRIGKRPGKIKKMRQDLNKWCDAREEYLKAKTRCKVEHVFQIMKCIFGFRKVCYKGIEKNLNRLFMIFSQVNILKMARIGVSLK